MNLFRSPKTRFFIFSVFVGIIVVLVLGLEGINIPYPSKYLIFVVAMVLYFVIVATLESYSRRKRV
jgi:quinol-cytochrome oxidoreductase complex cytochrome b subunit